LDRDAIDQAAQRLAAQRAGGAPIAALPEALRPPDLASGYLVQESVHAHLLAAGMGAIVGHKIGCTTAVMQAFLGIASPCAGGIFATTVQHRQGRFGHGGYRRVGVECEIAVRLGRTLTAADAPFDRARIAPAVDAVMAAIEVVDDRYDDYRVLGAPSLIADDFFNAGCVLGAPVTDWRELDLESLAGEMRVNGSVVGRGRGADIMGQPLAALAWLAGLFASRDRCLNAGEFVMLGSLVETRWVNPGDTVIVAIDRLGTVEASFPERL